MQVRAFTFAALFAASPAWAINKCTNANGKTVFQDAPCSGHSEQIEVRPATGNAPAAAASQAAAAPTRPKPDSSSELRRIELEQYLVRNKRDQVNGNLQDCQNKLDQLAQRKRTANNNLAGAVLESSISSEMQSVSVMCESKNRQLRAELEDLERELRDIKAKR
ncbi:MAG: DUF4124 domain-containing protein [Burkholderiales bacterium]|nr:DUF4124 domain-containing protein [Burkholderiales bacterium]